MNHNTMICGGANKFLLLTLTAVQASLQVTEDSSFNVFCNRGMQSIKEKRFPKKKTKKKTNETLQCYIKRQKDTLKINCYLLSF